MSRIIALCIEDCHPASESLRYLRCCALTGLQPGLALSAGGVVAWKGEDPASLRLVVSSDEKLVCYQEPGTAGAPPSGGASLVMQVHRGGRFVDVEEGRPIVLLDGDEITLGDRRLKLHVHGFVADSHDPEFYVAPETSSHAGLARAAGVAGVAMAGLMAMSGCDKAPPDKPVEPPIDVRDRPPVPAPPPMEPEMKPEPPMPPIDVRDQPPIAPPPLKEIQIPDMPSPPPPPMEPVVEPAMEPVNPPIEMRPMPPVKPIPMRDDRPAVPLKPPTGPQGG